MSQAAQTSETEITPQMFITVCKFVQVKKAARAILGQEKLTDDTPLGKHFGLINELAARLLGGPGNLVGCNSISTIRDLVWALPNPPLDKSNLTGVLGDLCKRRQEINEEYLITLAKFGRDLLERIPADINQRFVKNHFGTILAWLDQIIELRFDMLDNDIHDYRQGYGWRTREQIFHDMTGLKLAWQGMINVDIRSEDRNIAIYFTIPGHEW